MFWDGMLTALAVLSAGAAIANLIPYDQSDGQHMLDWYRSRSIR
jgi:Zn-dependent protease